MLWLRSKVTLTYEPAWIFKLVMSCQTGLITHFNIFFFILTVHNLPRFIIIRLKSFFLVIYCYNQRVLRMNSRQSPHLMLIPSLFNPPCKSAYGRDVSATTYTHISDWGRNVYVQRLNTKEIYLQRRCMVFLWSRRFPWSGIR